MKDLFFVSSCFAQHNNGKVSEGERVALRNGLIRPSDVKRDNRENGGHLVYNTDMDSAGNVLGMAYIDDDNTGFVCQWDDCSQASEKCRNKSRS